MKLLMVMFIGVVPWSAVSKAWMKLTEGGAHSYWIRIFLLIGRQLASQTRVKFSHAVVAGVVGPHGCEDLTDRAEVLLDQYLLDGLHLRVQNSGMDALVKNL